MNIATFFFITLLFKDILSHYLGEDIVLLTLLLLLSVMIFKYHSFKIKESKYVKLVFFFFILFLAQTFLFGFNISSYILGPIFAFFMPLDWIEKSKRMLIIIAFVNIGLMIYEHYIGSYIYDLVALDGSILNSKLFGGHAEMFRAKGLFAGPLSAVAYIYCVALFHNFNQKTSILIIIFGFLTVGRLALIIGSIHFIYTSKKSKVNILFGSILMFTVFYNLNESIVTFIVNALDINSSNNLSRFIAWEFGLSLISNFNITEILLGSSNILERTVGFENDWIRILYSTGILGLITYIYMIFKLKEGSSLIVFLTILGVMFIFPLIQSLTMTLLFSLYIKNIMYAKKNI